MMLCFYARTRTLPMNPPRFTYHGLVVFVDTEDIWEKQSVKEIMCCHASWCWLFIGIVGPRQCASRPFCRKKTNAPVFL